MGNGGWRGARHRRQVWQMAGLAIWLMGAACRFDLPPLSSADAADAPDSDAPPPARCMGLAPTCGASANESCCLVKPVEGGTFYRSFDGAGFTDSSAPATVSAFVLDKYEVTV